MIEEKLYDLLKSLGFVKRNMTNRIIRPLHKTNEFISINEDILFTTISYPPDQSIDEHIHQELRITFVRSGRGILVLGKRKIELAPGDLTLLLPNKPHSLEVTGDSDLIMSELVIALSQ
jgi:quercetin dioxygenase-like cupin family protein